MTEANSPKEKEVYDRTFCEHHVRRGTSLNPALWNGPLAECGCCHSVFGYINSGGITMDGKTFGRHWYPPDRCGSCGGKYHEY